MRLIVVKNLMNKILLSFIIIFSLLGTKLFAQNISNYQYLNPLPNSSYVSINSNILIRQGNVINKSSITNNLIDAVGTKSGLHTGKIILANDSRTLIFTPSIPFKTDEDVIVNLKDGLMTQDGQDAGELTFKFHTCLNANTLIQENDSVTNKTAQIARKILLTPDTALDPNLPLVIVDSSNHPAPGYFFLPSSPYIEIVDNEGTPVFYRNVNGDIYDFDLQPNGELTYFIYPVSLYGLDSSFNLVHTYYTDQAGGTANGFSVDVHELKVLPNGNYYLFGKRNVTMDLSQYGGSSSADIIDGALQEFDSSGNLIFQWDALDHYKITDIDQNDPNTLLTSSTIDFTHFNSFDFDSDGCLLISARNLDEITKVDPNTGNIIWRLGGKNNQFTFINDNIGFSRQHDIRRFSNGDISLFDNGVFHSTQVSSAVEYKLDEINKTATLVYRIYHDNIFTDTEGSVQELPDGNRVISWGHSYNPVVSEVTQQGSTILDLSYQYFIDNYRAFKYQWKTNLFTTNVDSLNFGKVSLGNSLTENITVYNPNNSAVTINQFYCSEPSFSTNVNVPVTIQPKDSLIVPITFKPLQDGNYSNSFNIRNLESFQGEPQLIARQVILSGTTQNISSINSNLITPAKFDLSQNYPNPFNPTTKINYTLPHEGQVTIEVYDLLGNKIATLINENKPAGNYNVEFDGSRLSSGVYFYTMRSGNFIKTKKLILLK